MTHNSTFPTCTDCNSIIELTTTHTDHELALCCDCPKYIEVPIDIMPDSW